MPAFRRGAALATAALALAALAGCATTPPAASPTPDATEDLSAAYVTPGKLTIATSEPAYPPYVLDDDPASGDGFESAVAYAVAEQLGFAKEDVVWVRDSWDQTIAPGPKDFDFNLQQVTILDDRKKAVDFSSPYYETTQAVVTIAGSAAENATSLEDLRGLLIGAASGTTSLTAIEQVIKPTAGAQVFNNNEDVVTALTVSHAVDAIVVDVPTAFYLTGAELDGGKIIGQLPDAGDGEQWGLVLEKDSPLTEAVSAAVDAIRANGTLAEITDRWLGTGGGVPLLQ